MASPVRSAASVSRSRELRLLELVVVVILIVTFIYVAINRMLVLRVAAERVAMERVLGIVKTAATLELAQLIMRGKPINAARLETANPMDWLARPPGNYLGALDGPDPARIRGGEWYFDTRNHFLIYRVANGKYFETVLPGPARAEFKVALAYTDMNHNGRYDPTVDKLGAIRIVPVQPYRWRHTPAE